jgi:hypothetical protein
MYNSLMPHRFRHFYKEYAEKPDLYGPLWIYSTLVCFLFISGNITRYIETEEDEDFTYTFKLVPVAALLLFCVGVGLPLLIKFLLNMYGKKEEPTPLANAVGIFGYSFASFLVPILICSIPVAWL